MPELSPAEIEALRLSLKVALWSVCASLPFAIACAWVLARLDFHGKLLFDGLVHLPLVLPPVAVGYLLLVLLGRKGAIGAWMMDTFGITVSFNWKGAAIAAAVMAFPLMVRAIRLAIENIDQRLENAARTLGAKRLDIFFTITLPLTLPGILTGIVLAFARSLGEFGATITFVSNIPGETRTLPLMLYTLVQAPGNEAAAFDLMLILIGLSLFALALSELVARYMRSKLEG